MSDIDIVLPVWPFALVALAAVLLAAGCAAFAWRTAGWRRWLAAGLALLSALVAGVFLVGGVLFAWM